VLLGAGKKTPWASIFAEVEHASRVGEDDSRAAKCGVEAELSWWVASVVGERKRWEEDLIFPIHKDPVAPGHY
jgi:hypothetical protein